MKHFIACIKCLRIDCNIFVLKVRQQMKPDMAVKEVLIGKYYHVQVSSVHSHVIKVSLLLLLLLLLLLSLSIIVVIS